MRQLMEDTTDSSGTVCVLMLCYVFKVKSYYGGLARVQWLNFKAEDNQNEVSIPHLQVISE